MPLSAFSKDNVWEAAGHATRLHGSATAGNLLVDDAEEVDGAGRPELPVVRLFWLAVHVRLHGGSLCNGMKATQNSPH